MEICNRTRCFFDDELALSFFDEALYDMTKREVGQIESSYVALWHLIIPMGKFQPLRLISVAAILAFIFTGRGSSRLTSSSSSPASSEKGTTVSYSYPHAAVA